MTVAKAKAKPRKPRVDSRGEIQKIMAMATKRLSPPDHMPLIEADIPHWESIIGEMAKAHWTKHRLELSVVLARTMRMLDEAQQQLAKEEFVTKTDHGTQTNKLFGIAKQLTADVVSLRRSLALHARAKTMDGGGHGDNRNAAVEREKGLEFERKAMEAMNDDDDDDELIARPD